MRMLELFCGTCSVKKSIGVYFETVVSLDILQRFNPDICVDILDWDYTDFGVGHFDVIWASPPCTEYSKAKTRQPRNIQNANIITQRALEIIKYFKPLYWVVENPQTGLLKKQEFMKDIPFIDGDYCQYGFPYRKRTRFWTNIPGNLKQCDKSSCSQILNGKHKQSCGNGGQIYNITQYGKKEDRYQIPSLLIKELFLSTRLNSESQ